MSDDGKKYVSKEFFDYVVKALEDRIKQLEDNERWIVRTIGGSILVAILSLVLIGKKTGAL